MRSNSLKLKDTLIKSKKRPKSMFYIIKIILTREDSASVNFFQMVELHDSYMWKIKISCKKVGQKTLLKPNIFSKLEKVFLFLNSYSANYHKNECHVCNSFSKTSSDKISHWNRSNWSISRSYYKNLHVKHHFKVLIILTSMNTFSKKTLRTLRIKGIHIFSIFFKWRHSDRKWSKVASCMIKWPLSTKFL